MDMQKKRMNKMKNKGLRKLILGSYFFCQDQKCAIEDILKAQLNLKPKQNQKAAPLLYP